MPKPSVEHPPKPSVEPPPKPSVEPPPKPSVEPPPKPSVEPPPKPSVEPPPKPSVEPPPKPSDDDSLYTLYNPRKLLFNYAMDNNWENVKHLYRNKKVQGAPITSANDTLLHVAVSSAPEEIVLELLDIVELKDVLEVLNKRNKTGDTPLHLAAAIGLEKVCRKIAELCPDMVTSERNNLKETPLFLAVRHGNKNAFFELELVIHKNQNLTIYEHSLLRRDITHCTRDDGNNILHYAIKGEQFDLAYEIINLYPRLVDNVNTSGETALHTLANKPSVFKSGAHFGLCATTDPLKYSFVNYFMTTGRKDEQQDIDLQEDENKVMPIYKVCIDLYSLMKHSISWIINTNDGCSKIGISEACCIDVENPSSSSKTGKAPSSGEEGPYQSPSIVQEDPSSSSESIAAYIAASRSETGEAQKEPRRLYPKNYDTMILFFKMIVKLLLVVLRIGKWGALKGKWREQTIAELKQKHRNALEIMKELVDHSTLWGYEKASGGMQPDESSLSFEEIECLPIVETTPNQREGHLHYSIEDSLQFLIKAAKEVRIDMVEEKESTNRSYTESPVLVAAKSGITEMVKKILKKYPVAIFDQDKDAKNIVLLAVEHRQVHVYDHMLNFAALESVFGKLDTEGNSALHLAAKLRDSCLWSTGAAAALRIQWEIKWYKYVRSSMLIMRRGRSTTANNAGKMPEEVFIETHNELIKDGITALTNTCQLSCSVVAALFVAFQSVSAVPGGVDEQSGFPILRKRPVFQLFAISSLLSLCFSVTSVFVFLSILISNFKVWDFERRLPVKLILGQTSLFMAIVSTLVAFCAGDFYVSESLKFAAYPIYAIMCFSVTYFAAEQYQLYINLIKQTINKKVADPEMVQDYSS